MFRRQDGRQLRLTDSELIATGGEGKIYAVPGEPGLVAKVYHDASGASGRREKLLAMIANPPDDNATPGHVSIAWPRETISTSSGGFAGYLMPRINIRTTIHDAILPAKRQKAYPHFNYRYLLTIGANLASAIAAVHARGYVVGDLNELNVLVDDRALVTLVDTDSFQVPSGGGRFFRCNVGREEYTPPELQNIGSFADVDRDAIHDRFGLGVLLFQLLMEGYHPYSGVESAPADNWSLGVRIARGNFAFGSAQHPLSPPPKAPSSDVLHPPLRALFRNCFDDGKLDRKARPSAESWLANLTDATKRLQACGAAPNHVYGAHLAACPICKRGALLVAGAKKAAAAGAQLALPGSAKPAMSSQWSKISTSLQGLQQQSQALSPHHRAQLAQQWQQVQQQHVSLQQGWAQLSQQQAWEEEQRQLLAAQALLEQTQRALQEAIAQANAEIKPGVWRLEPNNSMSQQMAMLAAAAYTVRLAPNGSFDGEAEVNIMGSPAVARMQGSWGYDYRQRIFDLQGLAAPPQFGGMLGQFMVGQVPQVPQPMAMRFMVQPGPGPHYAAIYAENNLQWLIRRIG